MSLAQQSEDTSPSKEEIYQALLRSLARRKGFGIVFVQSSPFEAQRLIQQIQQDLPQKKIATLQLTEPITNLYELIEGRSDRDGLNILFIQDLEKSLEPFIKTGFGGEGDYYNIDTVPGILSHLNQRREIFRDRFNNICFVFILPAYAIKYFIRRAPDFFDWSTGVFEFPTDSEILEQEVQRLVEKKGYREYIKLTQEERNQQILRIQSFLEESYQSSERKVELLLQQGNIFIASKDYESALASYDEALKFQPSNETVHRERGFVLLNLGRYEEALANFDQSIEIQPECDKTWLYRGYALEKLGRYQEALASFDKATEIQPQDEQNWLYRGPVLRYLGRSQEAIDSYKKALEINPESYSAWNSLGFSLHKLSRYEEAVEQYDKALQIRPNYYYAWVNRGNALEKMKLYEEAVSSFDRALEIQPDSNRVWRLRANLLEDLGRYEEALKSYRKIGELKSEDFWDWYYQAYGLYYLCRYEEAIESYDTAIQLMKERFDDEYRWIARYQDLEISFHSNPSYLAFYGRSVALFKLGRYREAFISLRQFFLSYDFLGDALKTVTTIVVAVSKGKFGWQELSSASKQLSRLLGIKPRSPE
jgi:tetratricopeptide (TPR) repeat protein